MSSRGPARRSDDDRVRVAVHAEPPLVRAGLRGLLAFHDQLVVVDAERLGAVDVVLVDPSRTTASEMADLVAWVRERDARLVAWSWREPQQRPRLGGEELPWVGKDADGSGLAQVLLAAARRTPTAPAPPTASDPTGEELSPREQEVLVLVAQGLSNREVAAHLFVTTNTVKTYVRTAYRKIGAHNRTQATRWVMAQRELDT